MSRHPSYPPPYTFIHSLSEPACKHATTSPQGSKRVGESLIGSQGREALSAAPASDRTPVRLIAAERLLTLMRPYSH